MEIKQLLKGWNKSRKPVVCGSIIVPFKFDEPSGTQNVVVEGIFS